jgi:DNA modification methylase
MRIDLRHGDCLEILPTIPASSVDMVLCDLPYGTTQNKWDSIIPLDRLWAEYRRICRGAIVLTAAQPFTSALVMSAPDLFKYQWVWDKSQVTGFLNAKKQPLRRHEDVLVFYSRQPTYNPQFSDGKPYSISRSHATSNYGSQVYNSTDSDGRRYPTSILAIPQPRVKDGHPTQKPVALFEYLIRTYTNEGETVLDNTMGSGTTGVACRLAGRSFVGIERDPSYFAIAEQRINGANDNRRPAVARARPAAVPCPDAARYDRGECCGGHCFAQANDNRPADLFSAVAA